MKQRFYILLVLALAACSNRTPHKSENTTPSAAAYLIPPIDTARILATLHIPEKIYRPDLAAAESREDLFPKMDTLELTYMAYACDCQQWVDSREYHRISEHNRRCKSSTAYLELNTDTHGYYIEPADSSLQLKWNMEVSNNKLRFIGRLHQQKGFPEGETFQDPNPPKGKVFRYYGFEILKPYHIWGGTNILRKIDAATGDTLFDVACFEVRK